MGRAPTFSVWTPYRTLGDFVVLEKQVLYFCSWVFLIKLNDSGGYYFSLFFPFAFAFNSVLIPPMFIGEAYILCRLLHLNLIKVRHSCFGIKLLSRVLFEQRLRSFFAFAYISCTFDPENHMQCKSCNPAWLFSSAIVGIGLEVHLHEECSTQVKSFQAYGRVPKQFLVTLRRPGDCDDR